MQFNTIDDALKFIDFDAIATAMRVLNWKVLQQRDIVDLYYPTAEELKTDLAKLYNSIVLYPEPTNPTHLYGSSESGAFKVSKSKYKESELVGVRFMISADVLITKE
jgi:hypothetical protein